MTSYRFLIALALCVLSGHSAEAQSVDLSFLETAAERTRFVETTSYDELQVFLDLVDSASVDIEQETIGYSVEGRPLPLVTYERRDAELPPEERVRVLVMANIHAGEVAGKEAALMLLRRLASGVVPSWSDSLVLSVLPIYNADGNEDVSLFHRPHQHGPIGGMGRRTNEQGLDLNRDHMKLGSPEAHALVRLIDTLDPHLVVDLHTTNGTTHGYHLTYSPPLHPDTPTPIDSLLRNDWLPAVQERMEVRHGLYTYYYGNTPGRYFEAPPGWYTFDYRPRFNNNYVGVRNRFAILSEAYAYDTFRGRTLSTLRFVEEILAYAGAQRTRIQQIVAEADQEAIDGRPVTLAAEHHRSQVRRPIRMGAVDTLRHPYTSRPLYRRTSEVRIDSLYEYGRFEATENITAPRRYFVPPGMGEVVARLDAHGITLDTLQAGERRIVEEFQVDSVRVAKEPYQNVRPRTFFGRYRQRERELAPGTVVVDVRQPLGRLAVLLLEPRSSDGFAHWGLVPHAADVSEPYPIRREMQ